MAKAKLCKLCHQRPAEVPDRETYCGRWRREVCKECHGKRLAGDLAEILKAHEMAQAERAKRVVPVPPSGKEGA